MAALSDFKDVPALKYLFIKDATSGKQAFFDFDSVMVRLQGIDYDITRLKNDVLKLKDRFDDLDAALETIDKALATIREIRKELLDAMSALRQEFRDEITRLDGELSAHDGRIAALEAKAAALQKAIEAIEDRLDLIALDLERVQNQANENTEAIKKLQKNLVQIEALIVDLSAEINGIKQDLRDNYAKLHEANIFTNANTFNELVTLERDPVTDKDAVNKKYVDESLERALLPAGSIIAFAGSVVPNGYLLCDGTAVSKTDYANLYNSIGGIYGETDDTFKLPDLRDRFIMGGAFPSSNSIDPELPNIMGNFTGFGDPALSDGAFSSVIATASRGKIEAGKTDAMLLTHFDASKYSPYYKNSASKIVPPSYMMMYLIKV